jgi:phage major head subunit gpT-like protein
MQINAATLDALRTDFSMAFAAAYAATEAWYEKLATTVTSKAKSNTYGWIAMQLALEEWIGPRTASNLSEHPFTVFNKKYSGVIELDRDDIEDDNLGMFSSMTVPQFGNAVKKHPDRLIKAMLQANPTAFDGKALFANDHPCFDAAGSTYDNLNTSNLDAAGVATVYAAMTSITGEDGNPLGIEPSAIIVPPQLKREAMTVMNSTTYALPGTIATVGSATVDNALRGWMEVICLPELANQPTVWYMADLKKPIKPILYQLRSPFDLVARISTEDPKVFEQDKFTWGTRGRCNVAPTLPFLISKNTHTP